MRSSVTRASVTARTVLGECILTCRANKRIVKYVVVLSLASVGLCPSTFRLGVPIEEQLRSGWLLGRVSVTHTKNAEAPHVLLGAQVWQTDVLHTVFR